MIIVDSNSWADYFNGVSTPWVARLDVALETEEDIAVLPIVLTEVLQRFRSSRGFELARSVLTALPVIQPDVSIHVEAARMSRKLRGKQ